MKRFIKPMAVTLAAGTVFLAACAKSSTTAASPTDTSPASSSPSATAAALVIDSKAADLRTSVNLLFAEHLDVAIKAVDAALGGRTAEFTAYGDILNTNGTDIGGLIGQVYGAGAQTRFNGIWSAHNADFVEYTTGLATNDKTKQDDGVKQLTTVYIPQFSKFVSDATGLPLDAVTGLVTEHITTTKAVVDDQAAKKQPDAAKADRMAGQHMQKIGDPLAKAIVAKLPAKFS